MKEYATVRSLADARLEGYERDANSCLRLRIRLWNDELLELAAPDLTYLVDNGTWDIDAIVHLDVAGDEGFGILSSEGKVTLRFLAKALLDLPQESTEGPNGASRP